jgi:hypothetical protein
VKSKEEGKDKRELSKDKKKVIVKQRPKKEDELPKEEPKVEVQKEGEPRIREVLELA